MFKPEDLNRQLLASEVDIARGLYHECQAAGYGEARIAALLYRAGRLAGRMEAKARGDKACMALHLAKERIKALEAQRPEAKLQANEQEENEQ